MNLVDITHAPEIWKPFFEKYRHRIYFGSDNYLHACYRDAIMQNHTGQSTMLRQTLEYKPEEAFQSICGQIIPLELPDDILQDIYYNNHARLHPQPRQVDSRLVAEEAMQLLEQFAEASLPLSPDANYSVEIANLKQAQQYFSKL